MTGFERSGSDSSLGVQTPEGIEFVLYPAGILIRACAWAIDAFIQGTLVVIIIIAAELFFRMMGIWLLLIMLFVIDWFYHSAFEVFWRGQSPGKRFMGIRVVRADGSPVNPGASFLRNLLRFADTFMFLYLIAFICMIASPGFRRSGDWVADTVVVYTGHAQPHGRFVSPASRRPGMPWLANVPMVTPSRKLGYEEKQAILAFARRYPLLGKARADEIAGIWADKLKGHSHDSRASLDSRDVPAAAEADDSASAYFLGIAHNISG